MAEPVLACGFEERDRERIVALLREYEAGIGVSLCFQSFEAELAGLPGDYAPPKGAMVLARQAGGQELLGCVALRPVPGSPGLVRDEAPLRAPGRARQRARPQAGARRHGARRAGWATAAYASTRCPA